ncbi:hypothetical protein CERSUDRAFT_127834, partial [Gelatoporia subvermispora B]
VAASDELDVTTEFSGIARLRQGITPSGVYIDEATGLQRARTLGGPAPDRDRSPGPRTRTAARQDNHQHRHTRRRRLALRPCVARARPHRRAPCRPRGARAQ